MSLALATVLRMKRPLGVLIDTRMLHSADTGGLVSVTPGWEATRLPACGAFCSRENDTGPTRATSKVCQTASRGVPWLPATPAMNAELSPPVAPVATPQRIWRASPSFGDSIFWGSSQDHSPVTRADD